jgi:hypothetical protein
LFEGCQKSIPELSQTDIQTKFLTGLGNKYWTLKKRFINEKEIPLPVSGSTYWKTFTLSSTEEHKGSFITSDGYKGDWNLTATNELVEIVKNFNLGDIVITQNIYTLNENVLDVRFIVSRDTTHLIFSAY